MESISWSTEDWLPHPEGERCAGSSGDGKLDGERRDTYDERSVFTFDWSPEPGREVAGVGTFDGRVVIVTGAARGLGRDYARFFARDGASVVLADVKDTEKAAADAGGDSIGVETDVTSRDSIRAMMRLTEERFGRLDILINNAGLWRDMNEGGLLNCPDDIWERGWAVNLTGTLRCYQEAVPLMAKNRWGRIVNISSQAARFGGSVYGLTKHTVEHMTMGMAREVGDLGITVNCVAPGICAFEAATEQLPTADSIVANNAIKRMGTTRDLYGAISFLCSPAGDWVTGQTVHVDGGA